MSLDDLKAGNAEESITESSPTRTRPKPAYIAYPGGFPVKMKVGERKDIVISVAFNKEDLYKQGFNEEIDKKYKEDKIHILDDDTITVSLIPEDKDSFEIKSKPIQEKQVIISGTNSLWKFKIEAKKAGKHNLTINLKTCFDKEDHCQALEPKERTITVEATLNSKINDALSWFQRLWYAIFLPLLPWLWAERKSIKEFICKFIKNNNK
jgi:hypothetical protein